MKRYRKATNMYNKLSIYIFTIIYFADNGHIVKPTEVSTLSSFNKNLIMKLNYDEKSKSN